MTMNKILAAFFNSCRGLHVGATTERAVRQELMLLAIAMPAALILTPHLWVRVALIGVVLIVLAVEFLNTAIEKLCDHITPQHHPMIGIVKDYGSAAVFCSLALAGLVWGAALLEYFGR
jgi:diacylglycerol kinase (ATP)